jgi:hypothetical protein
MICLFTIFFFHRSAIPQQFLKRYGRPPTPEVPKIFVLSAVHFALQDEFCTPFDEVENVGGTSLATIYRGLLQRIEEINYFDPARTGTVEH